MKAVSEYKEHGNKVSNAQVQTLVRIWPKETNLHDLIDDPLGEDEEWEKGEAYMVQVAHMNTLFSRLKVWQFEEQWQEEKTILETFHERIQKAYDQIEKNDVFLKMIGYTLSIGNILNGGGPKGQADGFELAVFGKIAQMKDNTNQTMMQYILKKIYADDDTIHQKVKDLYKAVNIKEVDTKYLKTKTTEMKTLYSAVKGNFTDVEQDEFDDFQLHFREVVKKAETEVAEYDKI